LTGRALGEGVSGADRQHRTRGWLSTALFASLALTLGLPLLVAALWSLMNPATGWFAPDLLPRSVSAHFWQQTLRDPGILRSMVLSLFIATLVTVFSGALALPTAYALARFPFRAKRAVELFILAPLIVPGIIIAVGLGTIFFRLNLVYSIPGVVLVQTVGTLPFMIRVLTAALENIPEDLLLAGRTLGARPLQVARYIVVPLASPGFLAGGLLTFISSFEEFDKTFIVGSPFVQTLPIKLWSFLGGQLIVFPNAAVVTFVLIVPMLVIFFLAERFLKEDVLAAGMGKV
jgi:ABC-type spermidine/putrescine transport system permease subunit II